MAETKVPKTFRLSPSLVDRLEAERDPRRYATMTELVERALWDWLELKDCKTEALTRWLAAREDASRQGTEDAPARGRGKGKGSKPTRGRKPKRVTCACTLAHDDDNDRCPMTAARAAGCDCAEDWWLGPVHDDAREDCPFTQARERGALSADDDARVSDDDDDSADADDDARPCTRYVRGGRRCGVLVALAPADLAAVKSKGGAVDCGAHDIARTKPGAPAAGPFGWNDAAAGDDADARRARGTSPRAARGASATATATEDEGPSSW